MVKFNIFTIFPKILDSYICESVLGRALKSKLVEFKMIDLRKFSNDKWRRVDDTPYGGGAGMVMKVDVWYKALRHESMKALKHESKKTLKQKNKKTKILKHRIVLLTPAGKQFDQRMAERFSKLEEITFVCGRYEGIDARVEKFVDEKVSIGPYVLAGGELGAMVIAEAVARNIPGVLGNKESLDEETFSFKKEIKKYRNKEIEENAKEYPQYTRPEVFEYKDKKGKTRKLRVPKILLSGNHGKIKEWREEKSK